MQSDVVRDRPAQGRQSLVNRLLAQTLEAVRHAGTAHDAQPTVLDCGGGSGTYAVPLAVAGARVTVVDISADALATLRRRAQEAGVSQLVEPIQGEAEDLSRLLGGRRFDLVLAHGLLEAVDHADVAVEDLAAALLPGGRLSILVANPAAAVLARALAGDLSGALNELHGLGGALDPDGVVSLCHAAGLECIARHGVGTFSDLVPGAALDSPAAREILAQLDAETAGRAPFADIAGRTHLLARWAVDGS